MSIPEIEALKRKNLKTSYTAYEERAILARKIAGEIAEIAKTKLQVDAMLNLIDKQFNRAEIILPDYAIGDMGDVVEIPQESEDERKEQAKKKADKEAVERLHKIANGNYQDPHVCITFTEEKSVTEVLEKVESFFNNLMKKRLEREVKFANRESKDERKEPDHE